MDKRGFLETMLALGMAPAIVRADSLMRIVVPRHNVNVIRYSYDASGNIIGWSGVYYGDARILVPANTFGPKDSLRITVGIDGKMKATVVKSSLKLQPVLP